MSPGAAGRDADRARVYAAEDQWSAALDRGGRLEFWGSIVDLPVQLRFGTLEAMQAYVDRLAARHGVTGVGVRHRRGKTKAHYEDAEIAIPTDARWACRESVLLHEFAHHLAGTQQRHGVSYRACMLALVEAELGNVAALVLRVGYEAQGLTVVPDVD